MRAKSTLLRNIRRRGGAGGGRARLEGCGEDAVLVERALGAIFEVLPERGCGVKRNSGSCGEVASGVTTRGLTEIAQPYFDTKS